MLAGDTSKSKIDRHMRQAVKDTLGYELSDDDCQALMHKALEVLNKDYPTLTVKRLDGIIWFKYQQNSKEKKRTRKCHDTI
jgi:methionine salvage enolase-phosphatase E1